MRRLLQHWTESSIIPRFKRKVSLEEQKGPKRVPFPSWKTDRSPDLRVLPGHWSRWFCRELCRHMFNCSSNWWYSGNRFDGTEFCYLWRKSHLMTSWKDCRNKEYESPEKLKTVLELYKMEIHQMKAGLDYHRLKTMVKRSIEQNLRIKNFEARNGNYERNAVVKNQGTKQRGQRILGDCWQWEANGQCSKRDKCMQFP